MPTTLALDLSQSIAISTALCGALSTIAFRKEVLSLGGTLAAFGVGMVIGIAGNVTWLLLLLFFLLSSFLATRYRFALKEAMGVQEGTRGERRAANVLANGIAPMVVALASLPDASVFPKSVSGIVFLATLSVAGADTLASEIGVLSRRTYLITNLKRVPPGTDGGVSPLGQLCALGAALYTAVIGWFALFYVAEVYALLPTVPAATAFTIIPILVGFTGCQVDSLLGATLERRGLISKKFVNLVSTGTGAVLAYVLLVGMGGLTAS